MRVDPMCYYLGREKLGPSADTRVLDFSWWMDSSVGIRAGEAASCSVLG